MTDPSHTDAFTSSALLRAPFPPNLVSKLPKPTSRENPKGRCNVCHGWHGLPAVHLDYVGHADVTDRLLDADPTWTWEPLALDPNGLPAFDRDGGLWIRLTVGGVTRIGYGDASNGKGAKEAIGDALRNAAMRFGVALTLWSKADRDEADVAPLAPTEAEAGWVADELAAMDSAISREEVDEVAARVTTEHPEPSAGARHVIGAGLRAARERVSKAG